jgi:hypothetical protein
MLGARCGLGGRAVWRPGWRCNLPARAALESQHDFHSTPQPALPAGVRCRIDVGRAFDRAGPSFVVCARRASRQWPCRATSGRSHFSACTTAIAATAHVAKRPPKPMTTACSRLTWSIRIAPQGHAPQRDPSSKAIALIVWSVAARRGSPVDHSHRIRRAGRRRNSCFLPR